MSSSKSRLSPITSAAFAQAKQPVDVLFSLFEMETLCRQKKIAEIVPLIRAVRALKTDGRLVELPDDLLTAVESGATGGTEDVAKALRGLIQTSLASASEPPKERCPVGASDDAMNSMARREDDDD